MRREVDVEELLKYVMPFVGDINVHLETADRRMVAEPYGPHHPKAVGKVFRAEPMGHGETKAVGTAYVKSIVPVIFDAEVGDEVPIRVYGEATVGDERALLARIEYGPYERLPDLKKRNGTWLLLILYAGRRPPSEEGKRAKLIMAMLDFEYSFRDDMTAEERDALDVERQSFVMQMGWTRMSVAELEGQCRALLGNVPY